MSCSTVPPRHRPASHRRHPICGDPPPILPCHVARGKDEGGSPSLHAICCVVNLIVVCVNMRGESSQTTPPLPSPYAPLTLPPPPDHSLSVVVVVVVVVFVVVVVLLFRRCIPTGGGGGGRRSAVDGGGGMDDANALADADNRGGIDRDGDDDGGLAWVYRRAASSARLVARLLVKNVHRRPHLGGAYVGERGFLFCVCVCVVAAGRKYVCIHAFQSRATYVGSTISLQVPACGTCIRVSNLAATRMQVRKFCNTDAPGTKPTNSFVERCNTDASSKILQRRCVAEHELAVKLAD